MAVNQQPLSRSITLPTANVSSGNGLTQLANATGALNQALTERVNDVAIGNAALQGEQDVQEGRQPDSLALPFTKATKAYNDAVSNTEARRMVASAEELINESLATNKNPATFTRETPAKFHAELEGIKSGILENTRKENREKIREALDRMTAHASLNMLQHSIDFDNKQTKFDFQKDITGLLEARRNAAIEGDAQRIAGIDQALDATVGDYSTMNREIAQISPYLKQDIEKHKAIDAVLGGYTKASTSGSTARFMADLAENKEKLPFNVWQDAVKGVVALDQAQSRLKNDINAEQVAQVNLGISNGSIQDASDILNYPELTVPQQLTAMRQLDAIQAKQFKQGAQLITAQQNILSGRPEFNSAKTKDAMFQSSIQTLEQNTGAPATLVDMEQSVLGLNAYPSSGMAQTPMGSHVPAFDAVMQGKLTGGDVQATAQAAAVYNDMVNVQDKPNSVNLTGDALAVATLFNTLNKGGTTPEQAAELAINTVLNAKEPEIKERAERFHRTLEHINPYNGFSPLQNKFKDAFGTKPEVFKSDEAYNVFKDTYRANYLSSNSEEAAMKATTYAMRAWGKSKYFDSGSVGQPVPEKELPVAQIGEAFPNQIVSNLQGLINRTKVAKEANPNLNIPSIEWADPKQTISGTESEQDRVFKKLTVGSKPRIKIDGHETDVVLMPSAESRLGDRISYVYGVYDKFNNLHPLEDPTNGVDGAARFMPQELSTWAPTIAQSKSDEAIRKAALAVREQEKKQELNELEKSTPAWQVALGLASPEKYLEHIATSQGEGDTRLNEIINSLKGDVQSRTAAETREQVNQADNVGIAADNGQVIAGNIDLNTRPRVKRANGKISTVDSIGVESDGLEFVIPRISDDGKVLTNKEAIALFKRTKKHLGAFKTKEQANAFAKQLHESEAAKLIDEGLSDE